VKISVGSGFDPLHEGTRAVIRAASLSGIANRYVELHPGPNSAPKIESGGEISADRTQAPVDLDQLFNTLDPKTRKGLQDLVQGSATQYEGKTKQAGEAIKFFNPALSTSWRASCCWTASRSSASLPRPPRSSAPSTSGAPTWPR
jgi:phospholipid/cholesterol/gamma-HCH transport system substrate-binding protein